MKRLLSPASAVSYTHLDVYKRQGMLDMWSLILVPIAVVYGYHYIQTVVELSSTHMRIVRPAQIIPKPRCV